MLAGSRREEARLRPNRSVLLLLVGVVLGGGLLAWFALRGGSGGKATAEGPAFVVKSKGSRNLLDDLLGVELLVVDAAGTAGATVGFQGRGAPGRQDLRLPLPADVTRFRVRFRMGPEAAPGPWHDLGPYQVGVSTPGARVLQVGLVLEDHLDMTSIGRDPQPMPEPGIVARVLVRVRVPSGGEMWETLGTLHVKTGR